MTGWHIFAVLVAAAFAYLVFVNRRQQTYRTSVTFAEPPDVIFAAYFPSEGAATDGHPVWSGARFERTAVGFKAEVSLGGDGVRIEDVGLDVPRSASRRMTWRTSGGFLSLPADTIETRYAFDAEATGTRLTITSTITRGPLFSGMTERFLHPFQDRLEADLVLKWSGASSGTEDAPVPMIARSPIALVLAVVAITALVWYAGWLIGLMFATVIFFHELGHVLAARWYGHRRSTFVFVPFLGGLANVGPSATHAEHVVKTLAGPAFGLATLLVCSLGLILLYRGDASTSFTALALVTVLHAANLLPIGFLDGGQVLRSVTLSLGRFGRPAWLILGWGGLVAGAYLVWLLDNPFLWLVVLAGILILWSDTSGGTSSSGLLGWRGIVATIAAYLGLWLAHVVVFVFAAFYSPTLREITIAIPDATSVASVHLRFSADPVSDVLVPWNERRQWDWQADLLDGPARAAGRVTARRRLGFYVVRVTLLDGRECHVIEGLLDAPVTLTVDEVFVRERCRVVTPG